MARPGASIALLAALCTVAHALPALGQSETDKATATALFKDGKALMDAGKYAEACPKLEESQRLDPGGGTLLNLAVCHEKAGKTATAWSEFTQALGIARRDGRQERIELAQEHIKALEPTLARLSIVVPPTSEVPGLQVSRDGVALGKAVWGSAIPVDPGDHLIEAKAPGKVTWSFTAKVAPTPATVTVTVPPLEKSPEAPPPPASAPAPAASAGQQPPASSTRVELGPGRGGEGPGLQRTAAYVSFGLSVVGLAAGTYFGLRAFSLHDKSNDRCPNGNDSCTADGVDYNNQSKTSADISTFSFATAAFTAGLGTFLYLYGRPEEQGAQVRVAPQIGKDAGGVAVGGRF